MTFTKTKIMGIAIMAISISTIGLFLNPIAQDTSFDLLNWNPQTTVVNSIEDSILEVNGKNGISHFIAPLGTIVNYAEAKPSDVVDTMFLTDESGAWFQSSTGGGLSSPALGAPGSPVPLEAVLGGTPLTIVSPGDTVVFDFKSKTDATHTVTVLMKPEGSVLEADMDKAHNQEIALSFDKEGVYLFACKVHPYMLGIVAVPKDPDNPITTLTPIFGEGVEGDGRTVLPALGPDNLGLGELPSTAVVSILTMVAPVDGDVDGGNSLVGDLFGKANKWDIVDSSGNQLVTSQNIIGTVLSTPKSNANVLGLSLIPGPLPNPTSEGIGEVWINAQFERVDGQETETGEKPGTIIVHDAADPSADPIMKISSAGGSTTSGTIDASNPDPDAAGMWNNPHNMWTDVTNDVVYNGNWFGQWLNRIDRDSGDIQTSLEVGPAPTHIVTIQEGGPEGSDFGKLTLPLSGSDRILTIEDKFEDKGELKIVDNTQTGFRNNHPHGQWIATDGKTAIVPNVFQDFGLAGSISIIDTVEGEILNEIVWSDNEADLENALLLPIAGGIGVTPNGEKAYVSDAGSGVVSVIDMETGELETNIPVALNLAGEAKGVLTTLRVPIQTPVSPDGKYVVTAVLSYVSHVIPDQIAIIDTDTNTVTTFLDCPAGCHGVNWGAKELTEDDRDLDGNLTTYPYYAYVTSQHSNILSIVDPDPNNDGDASDATADYVRVGNPTDLELEANPTIGTGGQGIKPIPNVSDGWIQNTVQVCEGSELCSEDVRDWIKNLSCEQKEATSECSS